MGDGYDTSEVESDLMVLTKRVPIKHAVGDTIAYEYTIEAKENISEVTLRDVIPAGLEYVSSIPAAQVSGDELVWALGDVDEGGVVRGTLNVKATSVGTFSNCATITAIPRVCNTIIVGEPLLAISKVVADSTLILGEPADFTVTVTNTGNSIARNVVINDMLPEGLIAASPILFNIGDLDPAESKSVQVKADTTRSGTFNNIASARGSNVAEVTDDASVIVTTPGLTVEKTGTDTQYIGKRASYEIAVTNTGDMPLTGVSVTDTVGEGMTLTSAPGASVEGNTATWMISSISAGETKTFTVSTAAEIAGTYCNSVSVLDDDMSLSASDQACTTWKGYPAVLLEVIDTEDPLLLGNRSTYVIRVENQGNASDFNIAISANIPEELRILNATGPTSSQVDGGKITFMPFPELAPKEVIEYRINVEAANEGGARSLFELNTRLLGDPISETESTQVY